MQAGLTVERRDGIIRAMEVCLGLLPATILLLPFLLGGIGGLLIVLEGIATGTVSTAGSRLLMVRMLGDLLLWGGAAVAGMFGLWFSVFYAPPGMFWSSRGTAVTIIMCFTAGLMAAARWLCVMVETNPGNDLVTWATWLFLLLGPAIVGVRRTYRMFLPVPNAESSG